MRSDRDKLDVNQINRRNAVTALGVALAAVVIGLVLMLADIEERVGWVLVVVGAIAAGVILVINATSRRDRL